MAQDAYPVTPVPVPAPPPAKGLCQPSSPSITPARRLAAVPLFLGEEEWALRTGQPPPVRAHTHLVTLYFLILRVMPF